MQQAPRLRRGLARGRRFEASSEWTGPRRRSLRLRRADDVTRATKLEVDGGAGNESLVTIQYSTVRRTVAQKWATPPTLLPVSASMKKGYVLRAFPKHTQIQAYKAYDKEMYNVYRRTRHLQITQLRHLRKSLLGPDLSKMSRCPHRTSRTPPHSAIHVHKTATGSSCVATERIFSKHGKSSIEL